MGKTLVPGANVSLTRENPLLDEITIGFTWDVVQSNGPMPELVPSVIMCDEDGKALSDDDFFFFNRLPEDGSVDIENGDDEQIDVTLSLIPEAIKKLVFIVFIDPDVRQPGSFKSVRSSSIKVLDRAGNSITQFQIPDNTRSDVSVMVYGELYRYKDEWKFRATGQGYTSGLADVAKDYGVEL